MGGKVYSGHTKEIGWSKLNLASVENNPLQALEDIQVLHWHGDTFDLPAQAELLASSKLYPHQAFRVGNHILALQFHPEIASDSLEKWLIGHTGELRQANIAIPTLRAANLQFAPLLEMTSKTVLEQYLAQLNMAS